MIGFLIPFGIIIISYGYILIMIWKDQLYLQKQRTGQLDQSSRLVYRFSWIVFLICFCFLAFILPFTICDILEETGVVDINHSVRIVTLYFYWLQYTVNFIIYAATSEQYRKAYFYFLKKVIAHQNIFGLLIKL